MRMIPPTVFLGHICVRTPRSILRDIEKIPNNRQAWWARWIRQPSSSSMIAKDDKEVKRKEDGKTIKGVDGHWRTGLIAQARWGSINL